MKNDKKIKIDLTDQQFLRIAKKAHELDITFNQLCNKILEDLMKKSKKTLDK